MLPISKHLNQYKACFPLGIMVNWKTGRNGCAQCRKGKMVVGIPWRFSGMLGLPQEVRLCHDVLAPRLKRESWQCSKREGGWIQGQDLQVHGHLEEEILALWHSKQAPALQWEGIWLVDANICVVGSGSKPFTWDKSFNDKSNELLEQFQDFSGRPWDLHLWRAAQKCQAINSI